MKNGKLSGMPTGMTDKLIRNRRSVLIILVLAVMLLAPAALCYAGGTGYGVMLENETITIFDGGVELTVKEKWEYLDADAVNKYFHDGKNRSSYSDYDVALIPAFKDENIYVFIRYYDVGYIRKKADVDINRLTEKYSIHDYDDAKLFYGPVFDYGEGRSKISWGANLTRKNNRYYMYEEIHLTRDGYLRVELLYSEINADERFIANVWDIVSIAEGNRYKDFSHSTGRYCTFNALAYPLYGEYDEQWDRYWSPYPPNSTPRDFSEIGSTVVQPLLFIVIAVILILLALLLIRVIYLMRSESK